MSREHRALIVLTEDQLEQLLDLPEGYRVHHIGGDFARSAVLVAVEGDGPLPGLPPVHPGCEPPTLGGAFALRQAVVDGELFFRWSWTPEAAA